MRSDRLQMRRDLAAAETGEDREPQSELCKSGQAPEDEGPGRRVQRSQLRLAPPNGPGFHSSSFKGGECTLTVVLCYKC